MKYCVFLVAAGLALVGCTRTADAPSPPLSGLRLAAVWTCRSPGSDVAAAHELGFNGVIWNNPACVEPCHGLGMKAFRIVEPLRPRAGARLQEMLQDETLLPGADPAAGMEEHQAGGEPAAGRREVLERKLVCPLDPSAVDYAAGEAARALQQGYDGIVWDFIGYRNYHSCECETCRKALAEFMLAHPGMSREDASGAFYRKLLVDLYAVLYDKVKELDADAVVLTHTHPVFLPDPFHGLDVRVDCCAITAAWFFRPFWPMDKVREYSGRIVKGPYAYGGAEGMPMIGYYADGDLSAHIKDPDRLRDELDAVRNAGAKHVMICELGHVLRTPPAAAVIRAAFGQ
ncbi:MAG: hypothetical protein JW909_05475 [Planctomycetes bacterium]|nr:hypothetical protein [Planctomycetota bacterium]